MEVFVKNGCFSSMFVDSIVPSRPVLRYELYLQPYLKLNNIISSPTVSFWPYS